MIEAKVIRWYRTWGVVPNVSKPEVYFGYRWMDIQSWFNRGDEHGEQVEGWRA